MGDVSRIEVVGRGPVISNSVCSGCPGEEVIDANYKYSTDDPLGGYLSSSFGPCTGTTVYRFGI